MNYPIARVLSLAPTLALLTACGTTKVVDRWQSDVVEPVEPEKVAVLAVWPEQMQRLVIERDVVAKLRKQGRQRGGVERTGRHARRVDP